MTEILGLVLSQFPIKEIKFNLPEWTDVLSSEHRIHREALEMVVQLTENAEKASYNAQKVLAKVQRKVGFGAKKL